MIGQTKIFSWACPEAVLGPPSARRLAMVLGLYLAGVVPELSAQNQLYTFLGDPAYDNFGYSVAGAGDVDQDGHDDLIVGAPQAHTNGADSGSARVLSGADGSVLYTLYGSTANDLLGSSVAGAGDVNHDGFDDVIVGVPGADLYGPDSGSARVLSGVDGSILHTFHGDYLGDSFGWSVDGVGDVNHDGFDDLIVGAPRHDDNGTDSGSARVLSGKDGDILYTFLGDSAYDNSGYSVAGAGDVNQDGYGDFIVGAFGDDDNGLNSGSARVLSGIDGSILYTFYGDYSGDSFGWSADGVGDINQDGYADLVVGAPLADDNGTDSGSARVFSGIDGSVLHTFIGDHVGDLFAWRVEGVGDVNQDGYDDLIVGAPHADTNGVDSGSARVLSGIDGSILYTFLGDSVRDSFGYSVGGAGDVNRDGYGDLVIGAHVANSARVLSGKPLSLWSDTFELVGQAAGSQFLNIDAGTKHAGRYYWMFGSATGTTPGTAVGGVTIPLNVDTWTLAELSLLNTPTFMKFQGRLDAAGRGSASINLPQGLPAGLGFTMYHAYVVHNASFVPFMASNAVTVRIR